MMFLAPVLGGVVIHLIGTELTLSFVCICLFVSGTFLFYIKENRTSQPIRKTWLEQFFTVLLYFSQNQSSFGSVYFLLSCRVGVTMVTNLPYIKDELSADMQSTVISWQVFHFIRNWLSISRKSNI